VTTATLPSSRFRSLIRWPPRAPASRGRRRPSAGAPRTRSA